MSFLRSLFHFWLLNKLFGGHGNSSSSTPSDSCNRYDDYACDSFDHYGNIGGGYNDGCNCRFDNDSDGYHSHYDSDCDSGIFDETDDDF